MKDTHSGDYTKIKLNTKNVSRFLFFYISVESVHSR